MGEAIISPKLFWLIDMLSSLEHALSFVYVLFLIATLFLGSIYVYGLCTNANSCKYSQDTDTYKIIKMIESKVLPRLVCFSVIMLIISGAITILVPSKETMYQMLVSSMVTDENLDIASDTIKDGIDYLFEKIDAVNGNE